MRESIEKVNSMTKTQKKSKFSYLLKFITRFDFHLTIERCVRVEETGWELMGPRKKAKPRFGDGNLGESPVPRFPYDKGGRKNHLVALRDAENAEKMSLIVTEHDGQFTLMDSVVLSSF